MILKYELRLSKKAVKFLTKQQLSTQKRLAQALENIRIIPPKGDVVLMQGRSDVFRLRVGTYRIIFEMDHTEKITYVRAIGNRGDVYK